MNLLYGIELQQRAHKRNIKTQSSVRLKPSDSLRCWAPIQINSRPLYISISIWVYQTLYWGFFLCLLSWCLTSFPSIPMHSASVSIGRNAFGIFFQFFYNKTSLTNNTIFNVIWKTSLFVWKKKVFRKNILKVINSSKSCQGFVCRLWVSWLWLSWAGIISLLPGSEKKCSEVNGWGTHWL